MLFVSHSIKINGQELYGVVDTDDSVIEFITLSDYNNYLCQGISIIDWNTAQYNLTPSLVSRNNIKLYNRAKRMSHINDIIDYFKQFICYRMIDTFVLFKTGIDFNGDFRLYDYSETDGMFIIVVPLLNKMSCILKVFEYGDLQVGLLMEGFSFKKYPIGSGVLYHNLFRKHCVNPMGVHANCLYMCAYKDDTMDLLMLNISNLGTEKPLLIPNPKKVVLD